MGKPSLPDPAPNVHKKDPFFAQYNHPKWQKRRLEVLSSASFTCENCGDTESELHVHHKYYVKGRKLWEYGDRELASLCSACHKDAHKQKELFDALLHKAMRASASNLDILIGYLLGELEIGILPGTLDQEIGHYAWFLSTLAPLKAKEYSEDLQAMKGSCFTLDEIYDISAYLSDEDSDL